MNRDNYLVRQAFPFLFRAEAERVEAVVGLLREELGVDQEGLQQRLTRGVAIIGAATAMRQAPGNALDLLVVVGSNTAGDRVWAILAGIAPKLERRFGLHLSPVVLPQAELKARYEAGDPLIRAALKDSVTVSGRSLRELVGGDA